MTARERLDRIVTRVLERVAERESREPTREQRRVGPPASSSIARGGRRRAG